MPLSEKFSLVLIPQQIDVEDEVRTILKNCSFNVHFIDLHISTIPDYVVPDQ